MTSVGRVIFGPTRELRASRSFERPKSMTFTQPLPSARRVRKRFAGLMSRCTTPTECASAIASAAWSTQSTAVGTVTGPQRVTTSSRLWPSRYSSTRYGAPLSSVPTSKTRTTCSLWMRVAAHPSRRKRSTTSWSLDHSGSSILIATRRSSSRCIAEKTTASPPRPHGLSMTYFPAMVSPGTGRAQLSSSARLFIFRFQAATGPT